MRLLARWWKDERGATAVEYGLIGAIMTSIIVLGFTNLTDTLVALFGRIQTILANSVL